MPSSSLAMSLTSLRAIPNAFGVSGKGRAIRNCRSLADDPVGRQQSAELRRAAEVSDVLRPRTPHNAVAFRSHVQPLSREHPTTVRGGYDATPRVTEVSSRGMHGACDDDGMKLKDFGGGGIARRMYWNPDLVLAVVVFDGGADALATTGGGQQSGSRIKIVNFATAERSDHLEPEPFPRHAARPRLPNSPTAADGVLRCPVPTTGADLYPGFTHRRGLYVAGRVHSPRAQEGNPRSTSYQFVTQTTCPAGPYAITVYTVGAPGHNALCEERRQLRLLRARTSGLTTSML